MKQTQEEGGGLRHEIPRKMNARAFTALTKRRRLENLAQKSWIKLFFVIYYDEFPAQSESRERKEQRDSKRM